MSHYTLSMLFFLFIWPLFCFFFNNCINESLFEIRSFIMSSSTNKVKFSYCIPVSHYGCWPQAANNDPHPLIVSTVLNGKKKCWQLTEDDSLKRWPKSWTLTSNLLGLLPFFPACFPFLKAQISESKSLFLSCISGGVNPSCICSDVCT